MKLKKIADGPSSYVWYYQCPGCGIEHAFKDTLHTFNGDVNKPTIWPSLLHNNPQNYKTCHSFITDGRISYQSDSWHALKGQTVELPEYAS
jgi:hypothetical protein